jgi:hypothetical protein
MLHRLGPYDDEEALIEALKSYLPEYGKNKEICEVPWKDECVIMLAKFQWLAGNWVYLESYKRK